MNREKLRASGVPSAPRRALRADFTAYTLRHAAAAKRRAARKQQIKELFSMKSIKLMRTVPGAALALLVIATGSVGVYALSNWFGGGVTVTQTDQSVFAVDLAQCKGNLPPGVDSADRHNVQFKILGNPHISAAELQDKLLAQCEFDAVRDFYNERFPARNYGLSASVVRAIGNGEVTLAYNWGGETRQKSLRLSTGTTIYDQGRATTAADIHIGDTVIFTDQPSGPVLEGVDPLATVSEVQSIFKTQFDTRQAPEAALRKGFYEDNNIMPLDMYKQLQSKKNS